MTLQKLILSLSRLTYTGIDIYLSMSIDELLDWAEMIGEFDRK